LEITYVSSDKMSEIIETRKPLGLFIRKDNGIWIAVDNSTGDAWTEEFKNHTAASKWLRREQEEK